MCDATDKREEGAAVVTQRDVAKLAGTSTAVVSYVINDGPRNVTPQTRQRVLDAIEELQYRPNLLARSLRAARTATFGLIVPNVSNQFFAQLAHELEQAALQSGNLVLLGSADDDPQREQAYVASFLERQVDGLLIVGAASTSSVDTAIAAGVRTVVLDRPLSNSGLSTISIDHRAAARAATQHLIDHGHQRIACLTGPSGLSVAEDRLQGWRDALGAAGLPCGEDLVFRSQSNAPSGHAVGLQFAEVDDLPDATFIASDSQAEGFLSALARRGLRVPDDVAIVSLDGTPASAFRQPPLTVIQQPTAAMAQAAIKILTDSAGSHDSRLIVPFDLIVRESCGCPGPPPRD